MNTFRQILIVAAAGLLSLSCGGGASAPATGGGGGGGGGGPVAGIPVPSEVSALPTTGSGAAVARAAARALAAAPPAGSDYDLAVTRKFVNERSLSQFDILNTIFQAMAQTHYDDPANVNQGPYGAMVSWVEESEGNQGKQIVNWVVDSQMVSGVNLVKVWMLMPMGDGQIHLIKVAMRIEEPPTQRADGSYADYGVWRIDAKFDPLGNGFFVAQASRNPAGGSIVEMHQKDGPDMQPTRGILYKADAQGYGKVSYPDFSACTGPCDPMSGNAPPMVEVTYAYDGSHAALQKGAGPVVFKDRTSVVDLGNRYGLFDAATGEDVAHSHRFGFPVFVDDPAGRHYGYYGAWQGRHQIWADGQAVPAGTVVTRADRPPGQTPETYTVSERLVGTLVKRTLVAADIQDVKGLVVETFESRSFNLTWSGTAWETCVYAPPPPPPQPGDPPPPPPPPPTCTPFTDFASLVVSPGDTRHFANANRWDPTSGPKSYQYVPFGVLGAEGFYETTPPSPSGPPTLLDPPVLFVPAQGDQLWVNTGGSIYVSFDGIDWVRKTVLSFDTQTWTATFDPAGDLPFALELGREYYINNPGANYVVKRTGEGAYETWIELQSVANPANATSFVPAGTIFKPQWGDPSASSTYRFETNPDSPSYLKLVYETVGSNDQTSGALPGDVLESGQWGLVAWQGDVDTGVQFNWDYPRAGDNCGAQQFLLQGGSFVLLDNPIRLQPLSLVNHAGQAKTLQLQFDGSWVQGLPDIYNDLRKAGFNLTQDIADKVVLIPAGTEVVDADDPSLHYLFKPLDVSEYMPLIPDPGDLTLGAAAVIDLSAVPAFVDGHIGPRPDVPVKYSEGKPVQ